MSAVSGYTSNGLLPISLRTSIVVETTKNLWEANVMAFLRTILIALTLFAALAASPAMAQQKVLKIGVIYDYTGPIAAGGSELNAWGTKLGDRHD
jgi:hypothetical protein